MSTELGLPKPGGKGVGRMTSLEDIMQSPMIENSIECCVYPCLQDQNDRFKRLLWEGKHLGILTAEKWVCFFCIFQAQSQVSDYTLDNPCSGRTNVRLNEEMLGTASINRLVGQPRKGLVQTCVQDSRVGVQVVFPGLYLVEVLTAPKGGDHTCSLANLLPFKVASESGQSSMPLCTLIITPWASMVFPAVCFSLAE